MDALINYQEPAKTETFGQLYKIVQATEEFRNLTQKTQLRYNTSFEKFKDLHDTNALQSVIDIIRREGYTKVVKGKEVQKQYSTESIKYLRFVVNKIYKIAIRNNI
ncbi:hypothetical protein [Anaerococcus cruorum]|uniref:hypothetical protein n=1 Tax=Anaerococcus sp. WGS1529 TaxID=3366812 RepID=UPI00372D76A5